MQTKQILRIIIFFKKKKSRRVGEREKARSNQSRITDEAMAMASWFKKKLVNVGKNKNKVGNMKSSYNIAELISNDCCSLLVLLPDGDINECTDAKTYTHTYILHTRHLKHTHSQFPSLVRWRLRDDNNSCHIALQH